MGGPYTEVIPSLEDLPEIIVDSSGKGNYLTLQEAIDNTDPGTPILIKGHENERTQNN